MPDIFRFTTDEIMRLSPSLADNVIDVLKILLNTSMENIPLIVTWSACQILLYKNLVQMYYTAK